MLYIHRTINKFNITLHCAQAPLKEAHYTEAVVATNSWNVRCWRLRCLTCFSFIPGDVNSSLDWRHNERDGVSNHRLLDCLPNRLFRHRSKKISKLCVTGLCEVNRPVTGGFALQRTSNAKNVSIWWRHHVVWLCLRQVNNLQCEIMKIVTGPSSNFVFFMQPVQLGNRSFGFILFNFVKFKCLSVGYIYRFFLSILTWS